MIREKLTAGLIRLLRSRIGMEILDFMKIHVMITIRGFTVFSEDISKKHIEQFLSEMEVRDEVPKKNTGGYQPRKPIGPGSPPRGSGV